MVDNDRVETRRWIFLGCRHTRVIAPRAVPRGYAATRVRARPRAPESDPTARKWGRGGDVICWRLAERSRTRGA